MRISLSPNLLASRARDTYTSEMWVQAREEVRADGGGELSSGRHLRENERKRREREERGEKFEFPGALLSGCFLRLLSSGGQLRKRSRNQASSLPRSLAHMRAAYIHIYTCFACTCVRACVCICVDAAPRGFCLSPSPVGS